MMAISSAWLTKCDHEIIKARQVVQCTRESSFRLLLLKYSHLSISLSLMFIPVTDPVSLCEQFSCKHVCICLKRDKEAEPPTIRTVASVACIGSYCYPFFSFFFLPACWVKFFFQGI